MAGFREKSISLVANCASLLPNNWLQCCTKQRLIVPVYHLVDNAPTPHVKHLYRVKNEKEFETDLDFFLKYYTPISFEEVIDHVKGEKKVVKPSVFLTFDDGLRQCADIIGPLLWKKGVPAAFFINSGFVDNKALFFRYKVSLLIDTLHANPSLLQKEEVKRVLKNWQTDSYSANLLLKASYNETHLLDTLAKSMGFSFEAFLSSYQPYMNQMQLQNLVNQGFYVGAHSIDHPEYRLVSLQEQMAQTQQSLDYVVDTLGLNYRTFAFPFTDYGVKKAFFDSFQSVLDCSFGCAGLKGEPMPKHFQRIPLELGALGARQVIHAEYLYYLVKFVLNKHNIIRG
jgi:peptidoglycan/xylan/chitin deacetylase (PgdA/CDA1 family)